MERARSVFPQCRARGVALLVIAGFGAAGWGCTPASTPPPTNSTPSSHSSTQPVASKKDPLPSDLVQDVEELIRLTGEYNALAAEVQSPDEYRSRAADLKALERRLALCVTEVTAGEAQLDAGPRQEFDRRYFATRARPLIEERRKHERRIRALLQSEPRQERRDDTPETKTGPAKGDCMFRH